MAYVDRELAAESALSAVIALDRSDLGDIGKVDEAITKEINKLPTIADVALVRHGRWIDKGEYAVCTECGVRSGTQYDGVEPIPLMTQFCPNCGAKMDKREDTQ